MTSRTDVFTPRDVEQLTAHGLTAGEAANHLALLRTPPPAVVLDRPCTVGDGITQLHNDAEQRALIDRADEAAAAARVLKFVPASGAATRMFKDLIAARNDARTPTATPAAREFFDRLDSFAFGEELRRRSGLAAMPHDESEERHVLRTLLDEMRYAQLPKGLIPFHRVSKVRTAFEEQLLEATRYTRSADGVCRMHFTVAPEYRQEFEAKLAEVTPDIERRRRGSTLSVAFSEQHPSTDTLAADPSGEPFRTSDGALLFRPGGHGSLLRNLQHLGGDVVVIKNIDNVVPDESSSEVVRWKRILIGYLVQVQDETFELLATCAADDAPQAALDRAIAFAAFRFARRPAHELQTREEKRQFVLDALDRPLRICGVVRNEGEPGGAPFWTVAADGSRSVQIVESAQVDTADPEQLRIFKSSTHFNPVDIVCGLRSWKGEPFDLDRFIDPGAVFIAKKSYEGRDLNALERPGLWNGAMAGWNTICVEVPGSTFAPVKTVFDLLRPQHQPRAAVPAVLATAPLTGRVLVVDDQPINQRILQQILTGAGLEVEVAAEGERALELAREGNIDLVLLDIVLPGLDGYEVIGRLREQPETRDLPVIFISALDEVSDKVRGLELGGADYVVKPFNRQEVLARVRAQLRIRQLTASLARVNEQLVDRQEVLAEDLHAAADIQKALLPPAAIDTGELEISSIFQPSIEVGGDIFNAVELKQGMVAAYIADVSGHGVASSLLTVSVTQRLSPPAGLLTDAGASPAAVMRQLESEYPFERFGKYFSIVVAMIDPVRHELRYSTAGHPSPLLVRADGRTEWLDAGGPVIGMGFGLDFDEARVALAPGDRLVLYTDGVTEDESASGERFGTDALRQHFTGTRDLSLHDACVRLADVLHDRRGDVPPRDDIAVIAFELK